ncbi:MAG: hypothetical protein IKW06_02460 [Clostridia bacterium]|nr:hypothetical protein [Clostridia bacterium]
MTKEQKEKLSNRLVLNFGILLAAGLVLLYVNSALRGGFRAAGITYTIMLIVAVLCVLLGIFLFVWGKKKKPAVKNYSAVCLGVFIGCAMIYFSGLNLVPAYTKTVAVISVYIAMAVYFIVLSIITSIQLRKPTIKSEAELLARAKQMAGKKKKKRK